ncbi:MAG TPA: GNAT family N-acetyltransferase, partial [Anaerolineaceae bacterium]|nr:GNAT family N-acetyltransferase [Anaerolineaceae bacterium]
EVPDEAFMVLGLQSGALQGVKGIARYHPAFDHFS